MQKKITTRSTGSEKPDTLKSFIIGFAFVTMFCLLLLGYFLVQPPIAWQYMSKSYIFSIIGIGWIVCAVMLGIAYKYRAAFVPPKKVSSFKQCPYCAEKILAMTEVCRYCGMKLSQTISEKLCPKCNEPIKLEAVFCKHCRTFIGSQRQGNVTGGALSLASILLSCYVMSGTPYFAAVFLIPIALILAVVGTALGSRLTGACGIVLGLIMLNALGQQQTEINSQLQSLQQNLQAIQKN